VVIVSTALLGSRAHGAGKLNLFTEVRRAITIIGNLHYQLLRFRPDIVHINTPCSKFGLFRDLACAVITRLHGNDLVVHCRCDVAHMVDNPVSRLLYTLMIRLADDVITLSKSSHDYTLSVCGKESEVIPNFLPESRLARLRTTAQIHTVIRKAIYVGHVTRSKGCDTILTIARRLPHITFELVGPVSDDMSECVIPDNAVLVGDVPQDSVFDRLLDADVFLFPTLTEGFPNALVEAMACGLPVIASKVGAIPEMLEGEGGIMVEPGNPEGFVTAMTTLYEDHLLRHRMSQWNTQKVRSVYRENVVVDRILEVYRRLKQHTSRL
jgi:glycosyltransferase involved in cell wall biosynthesis